MTWLLESLLAHYGPQHWWPGDTQFEIMVGAILTQNTSWNNVVPAIAKLKTTNNLTPESILDLNPEVLANWIRPAGYCNIKSHRLHNLCRFIIANG
ncbi:endonuclease, partial [Achromatium sp. WMS2]